jgi:putative ABC transport system permease protein
VQHDFGMALEQRVGIAGAIHVHRDVAMNAAMISPFEMTRLPLICVAVGVSVLLLLGQAAMLAPALRASRVSPAEATRSA